MTAASSSGGVGVGAVAVLHLVELLLAFVASSFVLPALSRNHRKHQHECVSHSLFFSVVFSDWVLAAVGVVHHIAMLGQGGAAALRQALSGVVLDAVFQLAFVATLLWPPVLAVYALANGTSERSFLVRVNWQLTWLVAGGYGMLWTRAMQGDADADTFRTVQRYALSAILGGSMGVVVVVAAVLYSHQLGLFQTVEKRPIHDEKLLHYLVLVVGLQLPLAVCTWLGNDILPEVVKEIALAVALLVPTVNAFNYGSQETLELMQDKRTRSRTGGTTHTTATEDLLQSMDPKVVALEELDGLSAITFLAEGASGSVFKARWLGIDVAMKLIKLPNAGTNADLYQTIIHNAEQAFLEEASICARLRHPNITLFIRAGRYEGKLGILTEFCQRGSLKDVLKKHNPLAWKRKVSLALHVAKGLTYLHARNLTYIHRDLKASNILVTDTWQAKLADFGISKVSNFVKGSKGETSTRDGGGPGVGDEGDEGVDAGEGESVDPHMMTLRTMNECTSFAGTWRWNAPEILRDATHCRYSRSTDMYSFGMVLWEILSDGAVPFSDVRFDFEVRERVLANQRPPITSSRGCPDAFIHLILACWAQHPSTRPTAAHAAAQLTLIHEGMSRTTTKAVVAESIDRGSDPLTSSLYLPERSRSTFAARVTSFFRPQWRGGTTRTTAAAMSHSTLGHSRLGTSRLGLGISQLGSSRGGFAQSAKGLFFRSYVSTATSDDEDPCHKFAMLGSPHSTVRSSRSSSGGTHASTHTSTHTSTRRRGFSRETALPSLHEASEASTVDTADTGNDGGMSPIIELPVDAMLERSSHHTFILGDKRESDLEDALVRDSERVDVDGATERTRGFTFDSVRSGDSIVDASIVDGPHVDGPHVAEPVDEYYYPPRVRVLIPAVGATKPASTGREVARADAGMFI